MAERTSMPAAGSPARINLKTYVAELPLGTLAVGVDNIHHDVFLSPKFVELTGAYLLEFIRQNANLVFLAQSDRKFAKRRARRRQAPGSAIFRTCCMRESSAPNTAKILRSISFCASRC
jgi:hypothetical protein